MVCLLLLHPDKGVKVVVSSIRVMGMLPIHQGVVSDNPAEDVCSGPVPVPASAALHLEGDVKVPANVEGYHVE